MSTTSPGRPDALTAKILRAVTELARDLKPGELALRLTAKESLPVALTVQHTVTFEAVTTPGPGPLPETAIALPSMSELQGQLDKRLQVVRQEAGDLIDKWLAEYAQAYRSVLPPARCMVQRPNLGVQEVCGGCGGRRELTCAGCRGRGQVTCPSCGGRGRVTCSACGGSRQSRCFSCGGSGTHEVRDMDLSYTDRQNTMNQSMQMTRRVPCPGCGGSGSKPCGCDGTQACTCGSGSVTCGGCGGRGIVPCAGCAATGAVHHLARVQCTVNRSTVVDVTGGDEDQRTLRERVPFDAIGAMAADSGGVNLQRRERVEHRVTLGYTASIPVEAAEATMGKHSAAIRAYGPEREIYDHHQLVATLLEPDLANLERGVHDGSPAGPARQFLASEVNALIAEAAPQITKEGVVGGKPAVNPVRVIGQALLLAPATRLFRRSGILGKALLVLFGLSLLSQPVLSYVFLVLFGLVFEWRYQRNLPPEAPTPKSTPSVVVSDRAARALQSAIAVGMVNAAYVQRASAAIGAAIPKLYAPLVRPLLLWITAVATALSLVAMSVLPRWSSLDKAALIVILTGVAWLLVERRAYAALKTLLGDALYQRLRGNLGETRNRYRVAAAGALAVGWLLASLILRFVA